MAKVRKSAQGFDFSPPPGFKPIKENHRRNGGSDYVRRPDPATSYGGYNDNPRSERDDYHHRSNHDNNRYGGVESRSDRGYSRSDGYGSRDLDYDRPRNTRDHDYSNRKSDRDYVSQDFGKMDISRPSKSRVPESDLGMFYDGARTKSEYFDDGLANQFSSNKKHDPMENSDFQKDFKRELEQNIRNRANQKKWDGHGEPVQNLRQMKTTSDSYSQPAINVIDPVADYDDDDEPYTQNLRQTRHQHSDHRVDSGYDSKVHSREPSWTEPTPVEDKYQDRRYQKEHYKEERTRDLYNYKKESKSRDRPGRQVYDEYDNDRNRHRERAYDEYHESKNNPRTADHWDRDHNKHKNNHDRHAPSRYDDPYNSDPYAMRGARHGDRGERSHRPSKPRGRQVYNSDDDSLSPPRHREKIPQKVHEPHKQKKQSKQSFTEFSSQDDIPNREPPRKRDVERAQDRHRDRRHKEADSRDNQGRGGGHPPPRRAYEDEPVSSGYKPQPSETSVVEEPIDPHSIDIVKGWLKEDTNLFSGY